jgi:hypothetical protein
MPNERYTPRVGDRVIGSGRNEFPDDYETPDIIVGTIASIDGLTLWLSDAHYWITGERWDHGYYCVYKNSCRPAPEMPPSSNPFQRRYAAGLKMAQIKARQGFKGFVSAR